MAEEKKIYEKSTKDYRQELTDKICSQIEVMLDSIENAKGWNKPWFTSSALPRNPVTGTPYKGINVISLWAAGFPDPRFYTFNNANHLEKTRKSASNDMANLRDDLKAGKFTASEYQERFAKIEGVFQGLEKMGMADRNLPIHIQKGAVGTPIFKLVEFENKGTDVKLVDGEPEKRRMMVYAGTVFNASQIANINLANVPKYSFSPHEETEIHVQAMIQKTGLTIVNSEMGRAFYSPAQHKITMPNRDKFKSSDYYYDTLLHEIGHSTSKELKRDMSGKMGDAKYAREELIAELSSSMMAGELNIPHNPEIHENNAAYLKSWLSALKKDKNEIFFAAGKAQASVNYQNAIREEFKLENGLGNKQESVKAKPVEVVRTRQPEMAM